MQPLTALPGGQSQAMKRTASRPAPLQLDGAGAGEAHVRWTTPKVVVPRSPYNIDGKRSPARLAGQQLTVQAVLDPEIHVPKTVAVRVPGTPTAVKVTMKEGGTKRRAKVNDAGVKLVRRWNRRRSLAAKEEGDFVLLDELRRQFMANEDQSGENWELYSDKHLLMRESLKFDQRVRTVLHKIWLLYDQDHGRPSARPLLVSFCASLR